MTDGRIKSIVKKSLDPFVWFGGTCMAVSGLWLLYEQQWPSLLSAGMAFVFSPILFTVLMIPAGFCAGVMMVTEKRYPIASRISAVLAFVWFVTLMSGYPVASLMGAASAIEHGHTELALVWALSAALTPWGFFAARDRGNVFFTGLVFMSAVVGAIVFPLAAHQKWDFSQIFWAYWLGLGALVCLQALYEKFFFKPPVDVAADAAAVADATQPLDTSAPKSE